MLEVFVFFFFKRGTCDGNAYWFFSDQYYLQCKQTVSITNNPTYDTRQRVGLPIEWIRKFLEVKKYLYMLQDNG